MTTGCGMSNGFRTVIGFSAAGFDGSVLGGDTVLGEGGVKPNMFGFGEESVDGLAEASSVAASGFVGCDCVCNCGAAGFAAAAEFAGGFGFDAVVAGFVSPALVRSGGVWLQPDTTSEEPMRAVTKERGMSCRTVEVRRSIA